MIIMSYKDLIHSQMRMRIICGWGSENAWQLACEDQHVFFFIITTFFCLTLGFWSLIQYAKWLLCNNVLTRVFSRRIHAQPSLVKNRGPVVCQQKVVKTTHVCSQKGWLPCPTWQTSVYGFTVMVIQGFAVYLS